jgi:hypothetical protein
MSKELWRDYKRATPALDREFKTKAAFYRLIYGKAYKPWLRTA